LLKEKELRIQGGIEMEPQALYRGEGPMRTGILMSEGGSNAQRIIEKYLDDRDKDDVSFEPVVVITDNPDSNAVKIGSKGYLDRGFYLPVFCNSIDGFHRLNGHDGPRDPDLSLDKKMSLRMQYDMHHVKILTDFGVDCVVLAGYNWIVTPQICNTFLTVNVHPGDLRKRRPDGKPRYDGLAWVPSAKAILADDDEVRTSVHVVTEGLDEGGVLAVSEPQSVPQEVLSLEDRAILLGSAKSVQEIVDFSKAHSEVSVKQLGEIYPIVRYAADCQDRLKVNGDWVVFPKVLEYIASGRYAVDEKRRMVHFDDEHVPGGIVIGKTE
jgi:folate-dependent phosphoribosylglycinamide formyltransferase PurN